VWTGEEALANYRSRHQVRHTVAIDAGEGRAFLVWRGSAPVQGDSLEELAHLYLMHEELDAPKTQLEYETAFVARLRALWEEEQAFLPEPPPEASENPAKEPALVSVPADETPTVEALMESRRQQAEEAGWPASVVEALYGSATVAPEPDPSVLRKQLEAGVAIARELGLAAAAAGLEQVIERLGLVETAPEAAATLVEPPDQRERVDPWARRLLGSRSAMEEGGPPPETCSAS